MKYRYAALFAAAAAAVPLPQDGLLDTGDLALNGGGAGGGGNVILRRAEDGVVGNVGVGVSALGKGEATGVKNAKRSDAGLGSGILSDDQNSDDDDILGILRRSQDGSVPDDIGVGAVALRDGDGTGVKNAKRSEEDIINLGGGGHYSYDAYDDGDLVDLLKRSQDGDGTGVKNAKRDLIGLSAGNDLLGSDDDGKALDILRRSQDGAVTDGIGVGAVALGDGDGTGVKNAKRFEIGDIDVGSTGVGRTDSGLPIIDPDL